MTIENPRLPNEKALDAIQVMFVPISVGAAIILGNIKVPGLILVATHTFTGVNLAVLVFRKMAGLLPPKI